MGYKTVYTCDKCGHEQTNDAKDFWTVGITAQCSVHAGGAFVDGKSMFVCRPCLESFGIYLRYETKKENPDAVYPTTEELIIELAQRCGLAQ